MRANSGPPACRFLTVHRSRRPIRSSVPFSVTRASARRTLWSTAPCTTPTAADFPPVCRCFRKSSMRCQKNNLSASRLSPQTGTGRLFCCKKRGASLGGPSFCIKRLFFGFEQRQRRQENDVVAIGCVALGQHRRFADDGAAGLLGQHLQRVQRLAGADDVVHQQHPLAL